MSELSVIGRPALLVPFPFALDHDQANNAKSFQESGGAQLVLQKDLSPKVWLIFLWSGINNLESLAERAEKAKNQRNTRCNRSFGKVNHKNGLKPSPLFG